MRTSFGKPGGSFGFRLDLSPVVRKLLIVTLSVWGVQVILGLAGTTFFTDLFALNPEKALPWRPCMQMIATEPSRLRTTGLALVLMVFLPGQGLRQVHSS